VNALTYAIKCSPPTSFFFSCGFSEHWPVLYFPQLAVDPCIPDACCQINNRHASGLVSLRLNKNGSHMFRRKVWTGHQLSNKKEIVSLVRVSDRKSKLIGRSIYLLEPVKHTHWWWWWWCLGKSVWSPVMQLEKKSNSQELFVC
jgi:hypothetical protein